MLDNILDDVRLELWRAIDKHAPMNSLHEAYSVILEELDEFWDEVKKKSHERDPGKIHAELIQVAAMAVRAIYDVSERKAA